MKKLVLFTLLALSFNSLAFAANNFSSWNEWAPQMNLQPKHLDQFRSSLPPMGQQAWDNASEGTRRVAFLVMLGMRQVNENKISREDYYTAFKIANKAEAGYYMDKVAKVLNYPTFK